MNETTSAMTSAPHLLGTVPTAEWFTALSADVQADITEMVNENGYPLDDIQDFVEAYGVDAYTSGHYVTWCELTERSGVDNEAIEAFAEEFGIHRIEEFENAYRGEYDSEEDFAKEHVTGCYMMQYVPDWVVIDWQATWDNELSSSFTYNNGYVFLSDF